MNPAINGERNWQMLMALAAITDPDRPYTRRSFTPRFLEGRAWLKAQMQAAGLATRIDAAGNLIGHLKGNGSKAGVIAIGSHSDSVPSGGRFDGIAGVIAALECVLSWRERGIVLNHDVEIIDYLAEEPSEWGISCIGSRGITGFMDAKLLATPHPQTGETLADAIARMGGNPQLLEKRSDIAAAFELHIEQGQVLETEGIDVGIVSAIVGITRIEIVLDGQANHAGTTPMHLRRDALAGGADIALAAELFARDLAEENDGYFVATCGQIFATPNASNVIAGQCRLVFDIRSENRAQMVRFAEALERIAQETAERRGLQVARFARLTDTHPAASDAQLMQCLADAARAQGISAKVMASGAGHDAAFMSHIAPMVMLFVPSQEGKSHCPEEWTDETALGKGVAVLCDAVERFDGL
ncbi:MAG: Zn-dependent hydrolase [Cardiobacteriaceae bacterium]|nr:Zn-dependent hydrolase [Cardiobacteriaceae bacterium]